MRYLMAVLGSLILIGFNVLGNRYYVFRFKEKYDEKFIRWILYILLGMASGFLFAMYQYGAPKSIRMLCLIGGLVVVAKIDKRKAIIPNALLMLLLMIRVVTYVIECICIHDLLLIEMLTISALAGGLLGGLIFFVAKLISPQGIGMGDVKLFAVIGLYIGQSSIFIAMILSLIVAMICGLYQVFRKRITMKDSITFGPYIAVGTIIVMMIGV